jgi:hypothetical protein
MNVPKPVSIVSKRICDVWEDTNDESMRRHASAMSCPAAGEWYTGPRTLKGSRKGQYRDTGEVRKSAY